MLLIPEVTWKMLTDMVSEIFEHEGKVFPSPQDAATFLAQEAHEVIDLCMREKNYARNHDRPLDTMNKELAQTFMMWIVTCMVMNKNGLKIFEEFYEKSMDKE